MKNKAEIVRYQGVLKKIKIGRNKVEIRSHIMKNRDEIVRYKVKIKLQL